LAAKLQGRILDEKGITAKSLQQVNPDENKQKKQLKDFEKMRLQEAFANLSLKDKLALNILFKKNMKGKQGKKNPSSEAHGTIVEGDHESDCESENNHDRHIPKPIDEGMGNNGVGDEGMGDENDQSKDGSDDLGSVITDTDKESLDIAMKLMNANVRNSSHEKYFNLNFFSFLLNKLHTYNPIRSLRTWNKVHLFTKVSRNG
jgi:hypothetical protein